MYATLRILAATLFLSAFLLFMCQPMVGKMLLPYLGGAAAVWTTCVLFFQIVLLGGYAYDFAFNGEASAYKVTAPHDTALFTPDSLAARSIR